MVALVNFSSSVLGHDVCPPCQEFDDLLCLFLHAIINDFGLIVVSNLHPKTQEQKLEFIVFSLYFPRRYCNQFMLRNFNAILSHLITTDE